MAYKKTLSKHLAFVRKTPKLSKVNKGRAFMRQRVSKYLRQRLGSDVTSIILRLAGSPSMSTRKYNAWVKLAHAISARRVSPLYKKVRGRR